MMPAAQVAATDEAVPIIAVARDVTPPPTGSQARSQEPGRQEPQQQPQQQPQQEPQAMGGFSTTKADAGGPGAHQQEHTVRIQSEDSWLDMEDFEGSKRGPSTRCGKFVAKFLAFIRYRRFKVALFCIGVLCILAGILSYYLESLETQSKFFYRALYFVAAAFMSGILADIIVMLVQLVLDYSIAKASAANKDLEYKFTYITYYFSMVRSFTSRLIWTILVIIAFAVIVPRTADNSVSPSWAMAYYHLSRLLGILALVIATRIVSKVLRQWLAQDFGARSFRPRIRESLAHEHFIAALRGSEGTAVFKTLFNNSRNMSMEGGVDPEIWQTLMQYVISHHVDGSEPPSGKHVARKHAKATSGLAKRSRPIAIQIFARILAKLEELGHLRQKQEQEREQQEAKEAAAISEVDDNVNNARNQYPVEGSGSSPTAKGGSGTVSAARRASASSVASGTGTSASASATSRRPSFTAEGSILAGSKSMRGGDDNNNANSNANSNEDEDNEDEDEDDEDDQLAILSTLSNRLSASKSTNSIGDANVEEAKEDTHDAASQDARDSIDRDRMQQDDDMMGNSQLAEGVEGDAQAAPGTLARSGTSRRRWQRVNLARQQGMLRLNGGSNGGENNNTVAMSDAELAEDTFRLTKMVRKLAKDLNKVERDSSRPSLAGQTMVSSISSTRVGTRIILEEDFVDAFSRKDASVPWDKLWKKYLDPENTGFITWQRFRKRLLDMFEFRLNLALTILDAQAVIKSMDGLIMSGLIVVVLIIGLTMYSSDFVSLLASLGTVIVGYSFIFGSSVQECFDNVIFLFGMHPYDVGDVILIDDRRFKVARIRLLTTDFVRNDGSFIRRSNRTLRDVVLINLSTSEKHCQDFSTLLPAVEVTEHFMQLLQGDINKFVAQHLDMFASISTFVVEIAHPLDLQGELSARGTHPTHARVRFWVSFAFTFEEISRITAARTTFLLFIGDALRQRGVIKPLVIDGPHAPREREEPVAAVESVASSLLASSS